VASVWSRTRRRDCPGRRKKKAPEQAPALAPLGAPSAWVFLGGLHACRARLRFPRRKSVACDEFSCKGDSKTRETTFASRRGLVRAAGIGPGEPTAGQPPLNRRVVPVQASADSPVGEIRLRCFGPLRGDAQPRRPTRIEGGTAIGLSDPDPQRSRQSDRANAASWSRRVPRRKTDQAEADADWIQRPRGMAARFRGMHSGDPRECNARSTPNRGWRPRSID